MKNFIFIFSIFLFFFLSAPYSFAENTSSLIFKLYESEAFEEETEDLLQTSGETSPGRLTTVPFTHRILRTSDPQTVRQGEAHYLRERRATSLYEQQKEWTQMRQEESGKMLRSHREETPTQVRLPGLSPWYSLHWKNRLRAGYQEAQTSLKPEIPAKREFTNLRVLRRPSSLDGQMSGKSKLLRTLPTRSPWDERNSIR